MPYKFVEERENYAMYASGSVFYALPGHPALPVRLADEIFQQCLALWEPATQGQRCTLYDPCCGGAYHLATLAYFNWASIERIVASDIDGDALSLATRNLALLSIPGMERRIHELATLAEQFGKPSHAEALKHAMTLKARLLALHKSHAIETQLFQADATTGAIAAELRPHPVDLVITDIPYGEQTTWHSDDPVAQAASDPARRLLGALLPVVSPQGVVAVAATKGDKIAHDGYQQLKKLKVGKRQVVFLRPQGS